jgi:hypothetical protein
MKDIKDLLKAITIQDGTAYVSVNARQADEASNEPVVFKADDMATCIELRMRLCATQAQEKLNKGMTTSVSKESIFFKDHTAYNLPSMNCMATLYERLVNFGDKEFAGMDLVANFDTQELDQLLKAYVDGAKGWDYRASALCMALCESIYARCSCR